MFEFINDILRFIGALWAVVRLSLRFSPELLQAVETYRQSGWLILAVALLAGASQLLGQSVVLFINRVKPGRFVFTLILNGVLFALSLIVWATTIWLVGLWLFEVDRTWGTVVRLVSLGSAPYIFGFFILIPYLGPFVAKVLTVWSFLIVLAATAFTFEVGLLSGIVCVGLGWLLMVLLTNTIGRPVVAARNWIWHRITGSALDATAQDILLHFASTQADTSTTGQRQ